LKEQHLFKIELFSNNKNFLYQFNTYLLNKTLKKAFTHTHKKKKLKKLPTPNFCEYNMNRPIVSDISIASHRNKLYLKVGLY